MENLGQFSTHPDLPYFNTDIFSRTEVDHNFHFFFSRKHSTQPSTTSLSVFFCVFPVAASCAVVGVLRHLVPGWQLGALNRSTEKAENIKAFKGGEGRAIKEKITCFWLRP